MKTLENNGSVSKAMRESGYSPATAKNPQLLTKSKGWKELMDQQFPNRLLAKRHKELLDKREKSIVEYRSKQAGGKNIYEVLDQPDTLAVTKALDMAYKMKRFYPQQEGVVVPIQINIDIDKTIEKIYGSKRESS